MKPITVSQKRVMYLTLFSVIINCIFYYNFIHEHSKYFIPNNEEKLSTQNHTDKETSEFFAQIDRAAHPNCRKFRNSFPHIKEGYRDGDMDLAFTMVVHKDPRQIARLMRMIYRPNNFYCIHLDRRSPEAFQKAISGIAKCFGDTSNVQLVAVEDRVAVNWGDESVLRPQIICGVLALQQHSTWAYLLNIVGQEFPLKTNLEILAAIKALNRSNLIDGVNLMQFKPRVHGMNLPFAANWFKGSLYGAFRRDFLEAALISERLRPLRDFVLEHRALDNPDELFFPSLAYNPHLRLPGACIQSPTPPSDPRPVRFVIWSSLNMSCPTKYIREVCILGRQHVEQLKQVPHLIANKFHMDFHPDAYDDLEKWYFDKLTAEMARGGKVDPALNTRSYASRSCSRHHI